jgi:malate dehydrogenase (oxaloacetate-decarboxylating)(NADP+)
MSIPVFHDDQHGTAIISAAALINALEIAGKKHRRGQAGGLRRGRRGLRLPPPLRAAGIEEGERPPGRQPRGDLQGAHDLHDAHQGGVGRRDDARTLADACKDADVLRSAFRWRDRHQDMVRSMAKNPIVFAMANPDPRDLLRRRGRRAQRRDHGDGPLDYPNQVNNVLGFPFIFRGALDVRATDINTEMKLAAVAALAALAKRTCRTRCSRPTGSRDASFGREYLIPKPMDHRVLLQVAPAVAGRRSPAAWRAWRSPTGRPTSGAWRRWCRDASR